MLEVGHLIRRFCFDEWGGTENVVWNSALALTDLDVRSEILATSALNVPGVETRDGITIRRFPYFYPYFPLGSEAKLKLDKKGGNPYSPSLNCYLHKRKFDIVHAHTGARMAQMALARAKQWQVPCVLSLHGGFAAVPESEMHELLAPVRRKLPFGGVIDRLIGWRRDQIAAADGVICVGENEYNILSERYPGHRIIYLPNGVDTKKFCRQTTVDIRSLWHIPRDRSLLLCVSRIDYQKNQKALVELLPELVTGGENPHLLLIGPVTAQWYADELQKRAAELGVTDRVTLIPGLGANDDRLIAAYQAAECFVLPSLHEPFGIVALEAWSAGLPVLGSNVGGLGRLLEDGRTALVFDPGSPGALASAWMKLKKTPGLRDTLIGNGICEVQKYSWNIIAGRLFEFYLDVRKNYGK